ncbi:hypothetical protein Ctob_004543 [Chrysochromulina tobinii]|uniref:RNA-polymerase II-associated protein 3-like C-terminal domain-containing protein n=1 Tax=Chrysochromulina tobinii TaxID=1460289 RepID=A0A0M0JTS9_9EUKA|nr:hypothetical protein Ctob_004543 [Chrysochromulina tobinii]|eukprot:KOO29757.1 hypothetical protein Ctob_004543 [Chrysochromulina sp. CCMP291]
MADALEQKFEKLIKEMVAGMPDVESAEQLKQGLRRHWEKPPLEELELISRRTYNLREARLLLFFPEPVDMLAYVAFINGGGKGTPSNHPQNKLRKPFLAMLYMHHARSWRLMREFIREGGLIALAMGLEDDSPPLRAQYVDTFMQLTSCELHDWFHEPVLEPAVHKRFVDLASPGTRFVQALAANLGEKSPFPGGSYFCLQILAFWLSLVRYFYCEQKVLRLGAGLMSILEEWATTPGLPEEELELAAKLRDDFGRFPTVEVMSGQFVIGAAGTGTGMSPEEMLAKFEAQAADTSRALAGAECGAGTPPVPAAAELDEPQIAELLEVEGAPAATPAEVSPPAAAGNSASQEDEDDGAVSGPLDESLILSVGESAHGDAPAPGQPDAARAAALKKEGNDAFGRGAWAEALRAYSQALEAAAPAEVHLIFSNRTAAALKLASAVRSGAAPALPADAYYASSRSTSEYLRTLRAQSEAAQVTADGAAAALIARALEDARRCVRMHPEYIKGHYRLGLALLEANQPAEAVAALEAGLGRAPQNDELRAALRNARVAQETSRRGALKTAKEMAAKEAPAFAVATVAAVATKVADAAAASAAAAASYAPLPSSAQAFEREWKALVAAGSLAAQQAWLARLPSAHYAPLFKESLTEATLLSLLNALETALMGSSGAAEVEAACSTATQVLEGLASTRRFGMLLMFLDAKQKAVVKTVFGQLAKLGTPASAALKEAWEQK